jgi:hypothetical protein
MDFTGTKLLRTDATVNFGIGEGSELTIDTLKETDLFKNYFASAA